MAPARAAARPPESIKPGGTLKAALTGEPDTLDPATSTIYTGAQVYDNIFSKLIDIDTDGSFVGVLATDWSADDDKTWMFNLVDNATFHNGEAFTADDVKYTFERILDPKTASSYSPLYDTIKSVEVASPTQAVFHLKSPFGPFLSNLANNGEIVNQKAVEAADPARNPVGTGPFKFVEWVQGDHITLEKFDGYFKEGKPYLDGIEFKFLLVDQGRIDGLSAGRARLGRRGAPAEPLVALDRPLVHVRHVGDGGHPGLPGAEHREGAVRRQARPAGGVLGARPHADPRRRVLGRRRGGHRRGPDRLHLVRRDPAGHPRPGQGARAVGSRPGSPTASRSNTSACRNTPSC